MFLLFLRPVLVSFWLTPTASGLKWFLYVGFWSLAILQWLSLFAETTQQAAASLSALKATLSQSPSLLSHSCKMAWLFLPSHKNRGFVSCFLFIYSEAQKLTECLLWMLCVACKVKFGTFPIQSDASQADVSHGGGERACVTWRFSPCAAAAKPLQSCPTLCDPIDGSPPGFTVPGILQAITLERVAISFFNARKWKVKVKSLSCVRLFETPWTAAHQAPPSMGFSRQEHWSGLPLKLP